MVRIDNVSFCVIARNESFAIERCLKAIAEMPLSNCEVICVDSDSTDNTLDVMKSYNGKIQNFRIIQCSGYVNAAVARNTALRYATKLYVFYVDGDVELCPDFVFEALDRIKSGKADAVTGKLLEIQYSPDYKKEIRRLVRRKFMTKEKKCLMTGGIFLVRMEILAKVGEWDDSLVRNQDLDYTLKISRCGTFIQLPQFLGIHHTQGFHDRSWEHFRKGFPVFYGKLLRKNFDRPKAVIRLLRGERGFATFLLLCFVIVCSLICTIFSCFSLNFTVLVVFLCFLMDFFYSTVVKRQKLNQWLLHNYLIPPIVLFGFFTKSKYRKELTEFTLIA